MVHPLPPALGPQAQPPALPASRALTRDPARAWTGLGHRPAACLLALALGLGLAGRGAPWREAEVLAGPGVASADPARATAGRAAAEAGQEAQSAAAPLAPRRLGQVGGYSGALAVRGSLAVFAMGRRLRSADLSDPARPTLLGEGPELADLLHDIALSGDLAVVAAGNAGLWLLDLSDPRRPRAVGSLATPGVARGVAVDGGLAYLAAGDAGLLVVDITRPAQPRLLAIADTPGDAGDVVVTGRHAFVADWTEGLKVFDVAEVRAPRQVGALGMEGDAVGLALHGALLLVAQELGELLPIDVSQPAAPRLIEKHLGGGRVGAIQGHRVFITTEASRLRVIDVSNPGDIKVLIDDASIRGFGETLVALAPIEGQPQLAALGLGAGEDGLIMSVSTGTPESPQLVGHVRFAEAPSYAVLDIALFGKYAFVLATRPLGSGFGLKIVELSQTGAPRQVGALELPNVAGLSSLVVQGGYAYVAHREGLTVISVDDPTSPVWTSDLVMPSTMPALAVADGRVYLAHQRDGLTVIDVANPRAPKAVGAISGIGSVKGIVIDGPRATIGSSNGLHVYDITQPSDPKPLGRLDLGPIPWRGLAGGAGRVVATRDRGTGRSSLVIVDVSDPATPQMVEQIDLPAQPMPVVVNRDTAIVGFDPYEFGQVWIVDLSRPHEPDALRRLRVLPQTFALAAREDTVVTGSFDRGLEVFTTRPPVRPPLPERVWLPCVGVR